MKNPLQKTYSVPGTRKRYTGLKIAAGIGIAGAGAYLIGRLVKRIKLNGLAKHYGNTDEAVTALGIALGTEYSSIDPRSWSEDEEEAVKIVESNPDKMAEINRKYLKRYKRSLPKDLQKNLSLDQWNQIKDLVLVTSDPKPIPAHPRLRKKQFQSTESRFFKLHQ